jgi:hypothetical protein
LLEEKSNIILLLDYQLTCLDFKKKDVFKFWKIHFSKEEWDYFLIIYTAMKKR